MTNYALKATLSIINCKVECDKAKPADKALGMEFSEHGGDAASGYRLKLEMSSVRASSLIFENLQIIIQI